MSYRFDEPFPKLRYKYLTAIRNHGSTLQKVALAIHDLPVEYLAIFSPDGKKLGEFTSKLEDRVHVFPRLQEVLLRQEGCTLIHNHPNGSPPSYKDWGYYAEHRIGRSIVVTSESCFILEGLIPVGEFCTPEVVRFRTESVYYSYPQVISFLGRGTMMNAHMAKEFGLKFRCVSMYDIHSGKVQLDG